MITITARYRPRKTRPDPMVIPKTTMIPGHHESANRITPSPMRSNPPVIPPPTRSLSILHHDCRGRGAKTFSVKSHPRMASVRSKVNDVPVVVVEMWEGRTPEQKEKLIQSITRAFEESLGTKPESLHIVIHDVPRTNWGSKGQQASKATP